MSGISFSGLASGLDTASIIQQLMAIERQPRVRLDAKESLINQRTTLLRGFQTQLRAVQTAAADLRSVTLFQQKQAVESSDATKISAATIGGAGVGGYQLEVSQLANSAQRTFSFTSPAVDGTITIDGYATNVRAGATAQEVAAAINADRDAKVYAAATSDGTLVLSSRESGDNRADPVGDPDGYIVVSDSTGSLVEDPSRARAGRDAVYTVDGVARTSKSNTITDAIAGVTLTLKGVTTTSGPVTVSVGAPGADVEAIERKLQAFVDAYNTAVDAIRAKLTEKAVPDTRTAQDIKNGVADKRTTAQRQAGLLFGDSGLQSILTQMRQAIYTELGGLPEGMNSLADLGISTGAFSSSTSADTLAGKLTIDREKLTRALTEDPLGVRELLAGADGVGGWARSFESILDNATRSDGLLDSRIDGAEREIKALRDQMDSMDRRLALREASLQRMFTALEVAMSKSQQQSAWLAGQLAGLTSN
jgi:flagellar hook-associated protein 2